MEFEVPAYYYFQTELLLIHLFVLVSKKPFSFQETRRHKGKMKLIKKELKNACITFFDNNSFYEQKLK